AGRERSSNRPAASYHLPSPYCATTPEEGDHAMFRCINCVVDIVNQAGREFDTGSKSDQYTTSLNGLTQVGPITIDFAKFFGPVHPGTLRFGIALTGFRYEWHGVDFIKLEDHDLQRVFCRLDLVDVDPSNARCVVRVATGLRDNSFGPGDRWDDYFNASVGFCVIAIADDGIDVCNNSRQFRFDNVSFPLQDVDLLQLNRSRDNVVVFLRGFELEYEATEHFVLHAQAGIDIPNPGNQPML